MLIPPVQAVQKIVRNSSSTEYAHEKRLVESVKVSLNSRVQITVYDKHANLRG